jgi:hypothetical protein
LVGGALYDQIVEFLQPRVRMAMAAPPNAFIAAFMVGMGKFVKVIKSVINKASFY